jgi:hypothetical protein
MGTNEFSPTESELRFLQQRRAEYEANTREYRRFHDLRELRQYNQRLGFHFFDEDSMRFFASRITAVYHGDSPADYNIFISSERNTWSNAARYYTVRQLCIDGNIRDLSTFQQYSTSAQAKRAIEKYLKSGAAF